MASARAKQKLPTACCTLMPIGVNQTKLRKRLQSVLVIANVPSRQRILCAGTPSQHNKRNDRGPKDR